MPLPAPLPKWAKAALYLGEFAYSAGTALFDALSEEADAGAMAWAHITYHWSRTTPTGTSEDRAQVGFDVIKLTGGGNDPTWDNAQVLDVIGVLNPMFSALAAYTDNNATIVENRVYLKKFKELGPGFADMGDPIWVQPLSIAGGSSSEPSLPYQVAASVTEKTALRKHWGRFYLPNPAHTQLSGFGRWQPSYCDAIAGIVGDAYELLADDNYVVVVPSSATRTLFTVTAIQVDDIPDVQRRRRARDTAYRALAPIIP